MKNLIDNTIVGRTYIVLFLLLMTVSHLSAQIVDQSFVLASTGLFENLGIADHVASFTYGVGDLDGDGEKEIVVRVWDEGQRSKPGGEGLENNEGFQNRLYAYTYQGKLLWEFNTKASSEQFGFEYAAIAPMTIWDFDGDSKEEVVTLQGSDLVMLDENGRVQQRRRLAGLGKYIVSTVAFLTGRGNEPYIVVAYGKRSKVFAFDTRFNLYKKFDNRDFYGKNPAINIRACDFDDDGKDEIVFGLALLNEDLTLYLDGSQFGGFAGEGRSARSFVADIDPANPGLEWYFQRTATGKRGAPSFHEPKNWKGPYLIDIDGKRLLWHHKGSDSSKSGWGNLHRGWIGDTHPNIPGIEMLVTGQLWTGKSDWDRYENKAKKPETAILFDAQGNVISESGKTNIGYPVLWDDSDGAEYFQYRSGTLRRNFPNGPLISRGFARAVGSGEATITDVFGDWREEIIIADNRSNSHVLHIYSNSTTTDFPSRPSPAAGHHYRIHQASIGSGLPKPMPPDPDWPHNVDRTVQPPPVIHGFDPASGAPGSAVTLSGENFDKVFEVRFNNKPADRFVINSNSVVVVTIPTAATTGKITVLNAGGAGFSLEDFVVTEAQPGASWFFTPIEDTFVRSSRSQKNYGDNVEMRVRKSKSAEQISYLKFSVSGMTGGVVSAKIRLFVSVGGEGGSVHTVSNNYRNANQAWDEDGLTWENAPPVSGSPLSSLDSITLEEPVEFDVSAAVSGNGIYSFAIRSSALDVVKFQSKENAVAPVLEIITDSGESPAKPEIRSFAPAAGEVGTEVTLDGLNLSGAVSVTFAGEPASAFFVDSDNRIRATVPVDAVSGKIRVATPGGVTESSDDFVVQTPTQPVPSIFSFTPSGGEEGTEVTLNGDNFTGAHAVKFAGASSSFSVHSNTEIRAIVPKGAGSGPISVSTAAGTGTSAEDFTVEISPAEGPLSFLPTDDAYVRSSRASSNKGSARELRVRRTSSAQFIAYLKFTVTGLRETIHRARLRLYVRDAGPDAGSVYPVSNEMQGSDASWDEMNLTWENAPRISGSPLSSLGEVSKQTIVEFDVTAAITGNGVYSFAVKNNSSNRVKYRSRETSDPPELVIFTDGAVETESSSAPVISNFIPINGVAGTLVTIVGDHFNEAVSVRFHGVSAAFTVFSEREIHATVPAGAGTGPIRISTPGGSADSAREFAVISGTNPDAHTATFIPIEDSFVRSSKPNKNYGDSEELRARKNRSSEYITYLKFNLSGLSAGIEQATLRLSVTDGSSDGGTIYRAENTYQGSHDPWRELDLIWGNRPAMTRPALHSAEAVRTGETVEFDVTGAVSGNGVFTFAIRISSKDVLILGSKEAGAPPELEIKTTGGSLTAAKESIPPADANGLESPAQARQLPDVFSLQQNYPNPFNAGTTISYRLAEPSRVRLLIYNVRGQIVRELVNRVQDAGIQTVRWDSRSDMGLEVSSGIYFVRLEAGPHFFNREIVLQR
ncbi:MAG: DNRLRE domain-containing protein [bacterium]